MAHEDYCYPLADLQARAKKGYRWSWVVAYYLGLRGFTVEIGGFEMRAQDEANDRFRGEVDILISTDYGRAEGVEVKSKNVAFSWDPRSWPFPDVACYNIRKGRADRPVLYVSTVTSAVLGLADDGSRRFRAPMRDSKRQFDYRVYSAPVDLLLPFDDWCAAMRRRIQVVA